jgi:hypothetical protein
VVAQGDSRGHPEQTFFRPGNHSLSPFLQTNSLITNGLYNSVALYSLEQKANINRVDTFRLFFILSTFLFSL